MILARLAMGTGWLPPCVPSRPVPGSPTAASARPGQSGRGATPGRTRIVVIEAARVIGGTGRNSCMPTQATAATTRTAPAISTRDRSFRRPAPPGDRFAWRPARRGRTALPLTARGRNCVRRMTHHRNNHQPPGPARPQQTHQEKATASRSVVAMLPAPRNAADSRLRLYRTGRWRVGLAGRPRLAGCSTWAMTWAARPRGERLGRVNLLDVGDELDRLVDQVVTEVVPLLGRARRLHLVVVVHQIRIPLAGVTAQEAIKALEAAPQENARDASCVRGPGALSVRPPAA